MRPSGARTVALGILTSRVSGLLRQKVFGWFFGVGPFADVLQSAMRLPNAVQNLLGEQSLSAAFIPIYSRFLEEGREEDAGRFAGAAFALLFAVTSAAVLLGVLLARPIAAVFTAGFLGDAELVAQGVMEVDRYELTDRAIRILFPMTGLLVLASWALGVLNSHRRFLLPYMAPVLWNVAIITVVSGAAWSSGFAADPESAPLGQIEHWLIAWCWGGLLGGGLQFLVQLPAVLRLLGGFRPSFSLALPGVRDGVRAFGPALLGRGVVQIGQYLNLFMASFLRPGAPSALGYAVMLINLPLAAFGMSVAAAELPELSRASPEEAAELAGPRVERAVRQAAFVILPAVVGYLLFGFLVAGLLFRGGLFGIEGNWLVYATLVGYTLGLPWTAVSRILQNTFFALRDTKTPARIAAVRLVVGSGVGLVLMLLFDRFAVADLVALEGEGALYLGAAGLALGAALGDICELLLLRARLRRRVPGLLLPLGALGRFAARALVCALPSAVLWWLLPPMSIYLEAVLVLPLYPAFYLGWAWWRKSPELDLWIGRLG